MGIAQTRLTLSSPHFGMVNVFLMGLKNQLRQHTGAVTGLGMPVNLPSLGMNGLSGISVPGNTSCSLLTF